MSANTGCPTHFQFCIWLCELECKDLSRQLSECTSITARIIAHPYNAQVSFSPGTLDNTVLEKLCWNLRYCQLVQKIRKEAAQTSLSVQVDIDPKINSAQVGFPHKLKQRGHCVGYVGPFHAIFRQCLWQMVKINKDVEAFILKSAYEPN